MNGRASAKGKILTFRESTFLRARKLSLAGQKLRINIDGEIVTFDRADIEVQHHSLLVHRPPSDSIPDPSL